MVDVVGRLGKKIAVSFAVGLEGFAVQIGHAGSTALLHAGGVGITAHIERTSLVAVVAPCDSAFDNGFGDWCRCRSYCRCLRVGDGQCFDTEASTVV